MLVPVIAVTAVITLGFLLGGQENKGLSGSPKNLDIYISLFRELNAFYVDEIDPEKLVTRSINSMLATLDPYTVYYPEEETGDLDFMTTGKYGGLAL